MYAIIISLINIHIEVLVAIDIDNALRFNKSASMLQFIQNS